MTRLVFAAVAAAALGLALPPPAAAQATDQPAPTDRPRPESFVDLNVDLFGAVDRAFGSGDANPSEVGDRTYWGGNSTLFYGKAWRRYTFSAAAGASIRRLTEVTEGVLPSYTGSLTLAGPLSRRTKWDLTQSVEYGPVNAVAFFAPGDPIEGAQTTLPLVDYRLNDENQLTSGTRGTIGYSVSRHGTLSLSAGFYSSTSAFSPEVTNGGAYRRWDVGGRYSNQMTRYSTWYAGYRITRNSIGIDPGSLAATPFLHSIDSGLAYGRPLSFSRRTRISGQLGSSVIKDRTSNAAQWRLDAVASLSHEIGRTWLAFVAFQRNTQYLQSFADPVLSDAVTTRLSGQLTEKMSVHVLANYATGSVGFSGTGDNGYTLVSTSAGFRYAFLPQVASYVEYFLFDSDFDNAVTLTNARVTQAQRHGLRFGISIGTGLWGSRRRALEPIGESTR